jgi:hypothetical protein
MASLQQFNTYFKKGEQVFIGFRNGETHGYVSKVDYKGIYLIQLNHAKEYFYPWKHMELVCHAGYLVSQVNQAEAAKLIMVNIDRNNKDYDNYITFGLDRGFDFRKKKKSDNSFKLMEEFKNDQFNFKITIPKAEECMEKHFKALWDLYNSELFNKAKTYKDVDLGIRSFIRKDSTLLLDTSFNIQKFKFVSKREMRDEILIQGNIITGSVSLHYQNLVCSFPTQKYTGNTYVQILNADYIDRKIKNNKDKIKLENCSITNDNIDSILAVKTKRDLDKYINEFKYVYSSDPWELSGKPILSNVWKSDQGFCLLNLNAELFCN